MTKIWTLNARDNMLFDLVMQHANLAYIDLGPEIRQIHAQTVEMLASKGLAYEQLRSALVPHTEPELADMVLVFDRARIDDGWYGLAIADRVLPLLERDWSGSILEGDLIWPGKYEHKAVSLLRELPSLRLPAEIRTTGQFFAVYLTNLNKHRKQKLIDGLREYEPFIGGVETHYESPLKNWMSLTLANSYVKYQSTFIGAHEPDIERVDERNLRLWPLDEHGYRCVSVPSDFYFNPFLSYKIERSPVLDDSVSDTLHGLSTISGDPQKFDGFLGLR